MQRDQVSFPQQTWVHQDNPKPLLSDYLGTGIFEHKTHIFLFGQLPWYLSLSVAYSLKVIVECHNQQEEHKVWEQ